MYLLSLSHVSRLAFGAIINKSSATAEPLNHVILLVDSVHLTLIVLCLQAIGSSFKPLEAPQTGPVEFLREAVSRAQMQLHCSGGLFCVRALQH